MSNTTQPVPGGSTPTPRTRLSVFFQSLSPTSLRQRRVARLKAKYEAESELRSLRTQRRRSRIEGGEEIRQLKAKARADRAKLAREAELQRAKDKAAKIQLQRQSECQPLTGMDGNPLLIIASSRRMTVHAVLACIGIFLLPALGIGAVAYAVGAYLGHASITLMLGTAGTGVVMTAAGVLRYVRRAGNEPPDDNPAE
ncbi:hypothetical protein AB0P21_38585 [Kribbella sp. NPDC056861]|uniref:hypothetical protein n=1 Tax=Kribbella sp. NPDC056861 TaxID=3154857 RepID=UPI003412E047